MGSFPHSALFQWCLVLLCVLSGCSTPATSQVASADEPLSDFMIGTWKYEGDYTYRGYTYRDSFWVYSFQRDHVLRIWTKYDSGTCRYEHSAPNKILVDCSPRALDVETWSVERDGEFLLIQYDEESQPLAFQRLEP